MRPIRITTTLIAANAQGIAQAQSRSNAGAFTFNGSDVVGGQVSYQNASRIAFDSTGNENAKTFRVTGTVLFGGNPNISSHLTTEVLVGTLSSGQTVNFFYNVTGITSDGGTAGSVKWGNDGLQTSLICPLDNYCNPFNVGIDVELTSGTANFTVQTTTTSVQQFTLAPFWFDVPDSGLVAKSASVTGGLTKPVHAVRLKINSGVAGSVVSLKIVQSGTTG